MDYAMLQEELGKKGDNVPSLVKAVTANPALIDTVIDGLSAKTTVKYKCAKILSVLSGESPAMLYPHFDFFTKLLDSDNNILKWNAIDILANLTAVDADKKFDGLFRKFYGLLDEGSLITAAHVVEGSPVIVKSRPELEPRITAELLRAEVIPLPTSECRNILAGKVILSFSRYFGKSKNKEKMLSFAGKQLDNTRSATKKKAEQFVNKYKTK